MIAHSPSSLDQILIGSIFPRTKKLGLREEYPHEDSLNSGDSGCDADYLHFQDLPVDRILHR